MAGVRTALFIRSLLERRNADTVFGAAAMAAARRARPYVFVCACVCVRVRESVRQTRQTETDGPHAMYSGGAWKQMVPT